MPSKNKTLYTPPSRLNDDDSAAAQPIKAPTRPSSSSADRSMDAWETTASGRIDSARQDSWKLRSPMRDTPHRRLSADNMNQQQLTNGISSPAYKLPHDEGEDQNRRSRSRSRRSNSTERPVRRSSATRLTSDGSSSRHKQRDLMRVSSSEAAQMDALLSGKEKTLSAVVKPLAEGAEDQGRRHSKASKKHKSSKSAMKPSKSHKKESKKATTSIGWNDDVFIMEDSNENFRSSSGSPVLKRPARPSGDEMDLPPPLHESQKSRSRSSSKSNKRLNKHGRDMRISNKDKRDIRWHWNQMLISQSFRPYMQMLAENDDLLPDTDEMRVFEDSEGTSELEFAEVRDAMLEDTQLTEREIAAFFEGFALFNMKVRSLQSQLESAKAMNRTNDHAMMRLPSFRTIKDQSNPDEKRRALLSAFKSGGEGQAEKRKSYVRSMGSMTPQAFAQKSLRMLSIKKVKAEQKDDEEVQRLLKELEDSEKKQKKLEKQLRAAGVVIAEDIPFEEAKAQVERIAKRMGELGSSDVTHEDKTKEKELREEYFKLEQEMDKYSTALTLTDEWIEEQENEERKWEESNAADNLAALRKLRGHMPVNVKSMTESELCNEPTPNGKYLPLTIAKRFKRTNCLQLLRVDPDDIVRMHPSTLENLRVTGLTLTERRALYLHLQTIAPRWKSMQADAMTERKWTWFKTMKQNFKENLDAYQRHVDQYGPPGNHPYASRTNQDKGCPLIGKQCPLKADKLIDYDKEDYGFTQEAEYEVSNVRKADVEEPGAKAQREALELAREMKAKERGDALKAHYKGKLLQVSLASGSCGFMDEAMDRIEILEEKWIEERLSNPGITDDRRRTEMASFGEALNDLKLRILQFAERSGMQLTGKKDANADQPDIRSAVELGLSEEVYEFCVDFFKGIIERITELGTKDDRVMSSIDQLKDLLDELHERNLSTLMDLGVERPEPSRKRKSREEVKAEIKAKLRPEEEAGDGGEMSMLDAAAATRAAVGGRDPRGQADLMATLAGRGRGGEATGRGGLMAAIAARGRGRGGRGGGRDDLMSAIAGRGRGRGGRDGGRGDLMSAIAGRARGRAGGRDGGRGDLMSAIAARSRGAGKGGQGDLMAAIATRGRGRGGGRDARSSRGGGRGDLMAAIAARGQSESESDSIRQNPSGGSPTEASA